jgi:uncharacterized membrane protein
MMSHSISTKEPENTIIARNYGWILAGGFFFPLTIAAYRIAKKKRRQSGGIGPSHYNFQFRTASLALIATSAFYFCAAILLFNNQHATLLQQAHLHTRFILLINANWLVFLWIAVRCIRGLYLAGAGKEIKDPTTLRIWP